MKKKTTTKGRDEKKAAPPCETDDEGQVDVVAVVENARSLNDSLPPPSTTNGPRTSVARRQTVVDESIAREMRQLQAADAAVTDHQHQRPLQLSSTASLISSAGQ